MNKVFNYQSNGTGRDTYINSNNGGFYPTKSLNTEENSPRVGRVTQLPTLGSHFSLYHTDGTGRDTYIYSPQGGFCISSPRANFISKLRSYDHSCEKLRPNDHLRMSQLVKPLKEQERLLKLSHVVSDVTSRLILPKLVK